MATQFLFKRMFELPGLRLRDDALEELADAMRGDPSKKPLAHFPAGYTYLGQFVDHDISRDPTVGFPPGDIQPSTLFQSLSPNLDLDSLYGGPGGGNAAFFGANQKFLLGTTSGQALPNDLPRDAQGVAAIGESRNDENLVVAQLHLAFLKFHNAVIDRIAALDPTITGMQLRLEARRVVTLHYQWIVLRDFLRRILLPATWTRVIVNKKPVMWNPDDVPGEAMAVPIEFAFAAYRLGHSMVRESYSFNRNFNPASLGDLFTFTGSGGGAVPQLPSIWVIDWERFFDFSNGKPVNHANSIDTRVTSGLFALPIPAPSSLPLRNLMRGSRIGLPSGQALTKKLKLTLLSPAQLLAASQGDVIRKWGFDTKTPLWFHILREAEVSGVADAANAIGPTLGPVGSAIVADAFFALVRSAVHSIIRPAVWVPNQPATAWDPAKPLLRHLPASPNNRLPSVVANHFTMVDLLNFVNDKNPLGD